MHGRNEETMRRRPLIGQPDAQQGESYTCGDCANHREKIYLYCVFVGTAQIVMSQCGFRNWPCIFTMYYRIVLILAVRCTKHPMTHSLQYSCLASHCPPDSNWLRSVAHYGGHRVSLITTSQRSAPAWPYRKYDVPLAELQPRNAHPSIVVIAHTRFFLLFFYVVVCVLLSAQPE